jgi:AcrR family transcriptional regulator
VRRLAPARSHRHGALNPTRPALAQRRTAASRPPPKRKPGRPKAAAATGARGGSRKGVATRQLILDAAERCLAEGDFDGVSLRAIAEAAGVDIALVNYHFGAKENLLRDVINRRAQVIHEARVQALEEARHEAGNASPSVEAIVTAFLEPWLKKLASGNAHWQNYNRLLCRMSMMAKYLPLASGSLDATALHFINALRAALPKASAKSIYWGYMFLVGAMVQVMAGTGRVERLSNGLCHSEDVDGVLQEMVPFVAGGLRALETTGRRGAAAAARPLLDVTPSSDSTRDPLTAAPVGARSRAPRSSR